MDCISEQGVSRGRARPRDRALLVGKACEEDDCVSHVLTELFESVEIRAVVVARETRVERLFVCCICGEKSAELFSGSRTALPEERYSVFLFSECVVGVPVKAQPTTRCVNGRHPYIFEDVTSPFCPTSMFAREFPELFHLFGDVAQEIVLCVMAGFERDLGDGVLSDEAAVLCSPLEVGKESVTDRVGSIPKLVLAPEVDVHGNESTVHLLEVRECLCRDGAVSFLEHDQEIDVTPAGVRVLQYASKENPSYKPVLAREPGSVRLRERRERIYVWNVMMAYCLRREDFRHGVSRRVWWGFWAGREAFVG